MGIVPVWSRDTRAKMELKRHIRGMIRTKPVSCFHVQDQTDAQHSVREEIHNIRLTVLDNLNFASGHEAPQSINYSRSDTSKGNLYRRLDGDLRTCALVLPPKNADCA